MLDPNMKFPQVFENVYGTLRLVVTGVAGDSGTPIFMGYSQNVTSIATKWGCAWDKEGNCLACTGLSTSSRILEIRKLKPIVTPAQKAYDKLTIDQRAILAALQGKHNLAINYMIEALKVDVNLAREITTYASKKEFK